MKIIDQSQWPRLEHFHFFNAFDNPSFTVGCEVDISAMLAFAKDNGYSPFLCYLYLSTKAANSVTEFRTRIREQQIIEHSQIHASTTFLNPDNLFGFCHLDYHQDFAEFFVVASPTLEQRKQARTGLLDEKPRDDVIYYSSLPWINFTSFQHPDAGKDNVGIPKIMFGKFDKKGSNYMLPLSVTVHHGLMDGFHVGQYVEQFQQLLNSPQENLR